MVGGEKGEDSVTFFRLQLAAGHIYIINLWTFGVLNEKVSFPLSIRTSVLSPTLCAMDIVSDFFPPSSPHLLPEATNIPFPEHWYVELDQLPCLCHLEKIIWLPGYTEGA